MKRLLIFALLGFTLYSCKEKDLTGNNLVIPRENVVVSASYIYGKDINGNAEAAFKTDSMITNALGQRFFVDEIKFFFTNFFVEGFGDTTLFDSIFPVFTENVLTHRVGKLETGGYSGQIGFTVGIDSSDTRNFDPSFLPSWSIRSDTNGFDNLVIKGRLIDETAIDPIDTVGNIPFEIRLGTYQTTKVIRSPQMNFAIQDGFDLQLIMEVNFKRIFDQLDIADRPIILSDPIIPADLAAAIDIKDSLDIGLF